MRAISCHPRRALAGSVGRIWPAVGGGSVSGVRSAALRLRNGTSASLSPRHDKPASIDSRCDCLVDQLASLKKRTRRDRARWRTRYGCEVSARTRAVAQARRPARRGRRRTMRAHEASTAVIERERAIEMSCARSPSLGHRNAFGRPIAMLTFPVPLASRDDVNTGLLRAERDTGRVVSNPGPRAAS